MSSTFVDNTRHSVIDKESVFLLFEESLKVGRVVGDNDPMDGIWLATFILSNVDLNAFAMGLSKCVSYYVSKTGLIATHERSGAGRFARRWPPGDSRPCFGARGGSLNGLGGEREIIFVPLPGLRTSLG